MFVRSKSTKPESSASSSSRL